MIVNYLFFVILTENFQLLLFDFELEVLMLVIIIAQSNYFCFPSSHFFIHFCFFTLPDFFKRFPYFSFNSKILLRLILIDLSVFH